MISYDNYKNRIEKLAKAKRVLHKFRFLIAGVLAAVVAGSVALMVAKGSYMSAMTLSSQIIEFNQPYEITPAKAFLDAPSSQKIEYSLAGSNQWTNEKPVKAGKYVARTVSPKLVGYSYSDTVSFEIVPLAAEFTIDGDSVVYGDAPRYSIPQLLPQHRVEESQLQFKYADYGAARTQVSADESSLKIVDAAGDDFTGCYNISFSGKELNVLNRKINVRPVAATFEYNGSPVVYSGGVDQETLSSLAAGDQILIDARFSNGNSVTKLPINAGAYSIEIASVKIMHGNLDVTARYTVNELTAALTIQKRKLSFTTQSAERVYNGKPLTCDKFSYDNLADGQSIALAGNKLPSITEVGTLTNNYQIIVKGDDGWDVSSNYEIDYNYGELKVTPYKLSVTTGDLNEIYDGRPHDNYSFKLSDQPEDFVFSADRFGNTELAQITDYGTKPNKFAVVATLGGIDVTENFEITYNYGTLSIAKREITVVTGGLNEVYNGGEQYNADYANITGNGLVLGHSLSVDKLCTVTDVTEAGGAPNTTTYRVKDGERDVTDNYQITYENGKLIITPRHINVTTVTPEAHVYDASEFFDAEYTTTRADMAGEGLLNGDRLKLKGEPASITNVGSVPNVCEFYAMSANYVIDNVIYGTLTVAPRPITVVTAGASKVYDGEALSKTDGWQTYLYGDGTQKGLLGEDTLTLDTSATIPSITNFGTLTNEVKYTVPSNYAVAEYVNGTLEILKRRIIVSTETDKKVYDGAALSNSGYKTVWEKDETKSGLLNGDELTLFKPAEIREVGGPTLNNCEYYEPNDNYEIASYRYGTLTIKPRPIMVITPDASKTYDGIALSKNFGYTVKFAVYDKEQAQWLADDSEVGLISTDTLVCTFTAEITDVGSAPNDCEYTHFNSYNKSNYDIHYTYGTLKITGRKIVVVTADAERAYNGEALSKTDGWQTYLYGDGAQKGLLGEDTLTLDASATVPAITNFGTLENAVKYVASDNYIIEEYVNGTLTVTQREIVVTFNSASKVYDGAALSEKGYTTYWKENAEFKGLVGDDKLIIDDSTVPSLTDVGTKTNRFDFTLPEFEEGKSNYALYETFNGTLEVTERTLSVATGSATAVYSGKPLSQPQYEECYYLDADGVKQVGLVNGDQLAVLAPFSVTAVTPDGGTDNVVTYKVCDSNGDEVVGNYIIEYVKYGKLTVTPAKLNVTVSDVSGVIYGEEWAYASGKGNYVKAEGLVNDEQLEIAVYYTRNGEKVTPRHAATYSIELDIENCLVYLSEVYGGGETDGGIANYEVEYVAGELIIGKKSVTVTIADQTCAYGDDLPENSFEITAGLEEDGNLPYGEIFALTYGYSPENPKNVGTYAIKATNCAVYEGQTPIVADDYDIAYSDGKLVIGKRAVSLTLEEQNRIYGEAVDTVYVITDKQETELAYGEELRVSVNFCDGEGNPVSQPKNAGQYKVAAASCEIYLDGAKVEGGADNYDIVIADGVLNIGKKSVTVTIADQTCVYGDDLPENSFEITAGLDEDGNLPYGESLTLGYGYTPAAPKDAGEYAITSVSQTIDGTDANLNYDITVVGGTLTIGKKSITVTIADQTCAYGNALPENSYEITDGLDENGELPYGEELTLSYYYADDLTTAPKNAGEYRINVTDLLFNGNADGLDNYEVEVVYGKLTITPRDITVELNAIADVTYGDTFEYADEVGNYANVPDLAYGEKLKIGVKYLQNGEVTQAKNAGRYSAELSLSDCVFYKADGVTIIEGGANNYNIDSARVDGLIIHKRELQITLSAFFNDKSIVYGDYDFVNTFPYPDTAGNYDAANTTELAYGEQLKVAVKYTYEGIEDTTPRNVGKYYISLLTNPYADSCTFYDENGNEIEGGKNNYTVTNLTLGRMDIVARDIKVTISDLLNVTYGDFGAKVKYSEEIGNYDSVENIVYGERLKLTVKYQQHIAEELRDVEPKDVGLYVIALDGYTVYSSDGETVYGGENNYRLTTEAGTLEIIQKRITIFFDKIKCVYGETIPQPSYKIGGLEEGESLPYGDEITVTHVFRKNGEQGVYNVEAKNAGIYIISTGEVKINGETVETASLNGNYYISVSAGSLTIEKANLEVTLNDLPDVIYGKPVEYASETGNYVSANGLCYEEQLKVAVVYVNYTLGSQPVEALNAGSYAIELDGENSLTYSEDGGLIGAVTLNYNVTFTSGNVEILRRKVGVTFDDKQCVYGAPVPENTFTLNVDISDGASGTLTATSLPYGEELQFDNVYIKNGEEVKPLNAGVYGIKEGLVKVSGAEDGVNNYEITYNYASLTIDKKTVSIKLDDITAEYGDFAASVPSIGNFSVLSEESGEALAYGELLEVSVKFTEVGDEETKNYIIPRYVGKYSVVATLFTVYAHDSGAYGDEGFESGEGSQLTNYIIECVYGTLEIEKREITVVISEDTQYIYGAPEPAVNTYAIYSGGEEYTLPYDEYLNVSLKYYDMSGVLVDGVPVDAGEYVVKCDEAFINLSESVNDNYSAQFVDGKLTIRQRNITVTVGNYSCTYGEALPQLQFAITVNGQPYELPYGEKLALTFQYGLGGAWTNAPVNAGVYDIGIATVEVIGGNENADNYNITTNFGKLTVEKLQVTVSIDDASCTYGDELPEITYSVAEAPLPYGDVIALTFEFTSKSDGATYSIPEKAGAYAINIADAKVENGNANVQNYIINQAENNSPLLTIERAEIEIMLNGAGVTAFAYGSDFTSVICRADIIGAVNGQTVNVAVIYAPVATTRSDRGARAFAARAAQDAFVPVNVGKYTATLDWENCVVLNADGSAADGGIENYKFADGFVCSPVTFEITPKQINVTVDDASCTYGDELPEIVYTVAEAPLPFGDELKLSFKVEDENGNAAVNAGAYGISVDGASIEYGNADLANYSITYTNTATLTIKAKSVVIQVKDLAVPYGDEAQYPDFIGNYDKLLSSELANGEQFKITAVEYVQNGVAVEKPTQAGEYEIVLKTFEVYSQNGALLDGGANNYSVTDVNGTLTISAMVIVITTGTAQKEYDGNPLYCTDYTLSGATLAEGYTLEVDEKYSVTKATAAGGVDNLTTFKVMYGGEVSENYIISYAANCGKLIITKREIIIATDSATKDYDGSALTAGYTATYTGSGTFTQAFADGDIITVTKDTEITDAGITLNEIEYTIVGEDGEDAKNNYAITYTRGTLKINPLAVTVTLKGGLEVVYGEIIENIFTLSCGELPNGEELSFNIIYKLNGAVVTPVEVDGYFLLPVAKNYSMVVDESTYAITGGRKNVKNYVFSLGALAKISVTPRHIIVTTATSKHVYDGNVYSDSSYITVWAGNGISDGLLNGAELTVNSVTELTDFGSEINVCEYASPDGNYVIDRVDYGTISVLKREITVKTGNLIAEYNGERQFSKELPKVIAGSVADGQEMRVDVEYGYTDVTSTAGVDNTTTVKIFGDSDVTSNYTISYEYGKIIITARTLKVRTDGLKATYDGNAHSAEGYEATEGLLKDLGHALETALTFEVTDATAAEGVDNEIVVKVTCAGADVTANYSIEYDYGKIIIEPAAVTISLNRGVAVAYGNGNYAQLIVNNAAAGLVNGEKLNLALTYDRTVDGVGTYTAYADWANSTVTYADGTPSIKGVNNYKLTAQPAAVTFEIVKAQLSVTLNKDGVVKFEYGDDGYGDSICNATVEGLAAGETLDIAVTYKRNGGVISVPKNKGVYTAEIDWNNCAVTVNGTVKAGGLDNYALSSCPAAEFEITAKKLKVTMLDFEAEYGEELAYPAGVGNYAAVEGLAYGEQIEVTPKYLRGGAEVTPVFAGVYSVACGSVKVFADGAEVVGGEDNYEIETTEDTYGTLTIKGINLVVTRKNVSKIYDGAALELTEEAPADEVEFAYTDADGHQVTTLPAGYTFVLDGEFSTDGANVQKKLNTAGYKVLDGFGNKAGEFIITYADVETYLEITQKTLTVVTESDERSYNGEALTAGFTYDADALVLGHSVSVVSQAKQMVVGECANAYVLKITAADGGDMTGNYDIDCTEGTLKVTKLAVEVTLNNVNSVYGEEIPENGFTLDCGKLPVNEALTFSAAYFKDGAPVTVQTVDGYTLLNAGTYGIIADEGTVEVTGNGKDNYEFTFVDGVLTVEKRNIKVITDTVSKVYDGEMLHVGGYITVFADDESKAGLLNGALLELDQNEIDSNGITDVSAEGMLNKFAFSAPADGNYTIDLANCEYGTLTVTERTVTVVTGSDGKVYNGQPLSQPEYEECYYENEHGEKVTGLITSLSHALKLVTPFSVTNATESEGAENTVEYTVVDADGNSVAHNYNIEYVYGRLKIDRASLKITLNNGGKTEYVYGDTGYDAHIKQFTAVGLVSGETLTIALVYNSQDGAMPKNAGTYVASLDLENSFCTVNNGTDIENGIVNYDIECADVEFDVIKKSVTLVLGEWADEEYGAEHYYDEDDCTVAAGSSLAYGESLASIALKYYADAEKTVAVTTIKDAGTYYIEFDADMTMVSCADGFAIISENYEVSCEDITFTVTPKKFTVSLSDDESVYNGVEYDYSAGEGFTATGIADGDAIECVVTYSAAPVNAGNYTVTFDKDNLQFTSGNAENYVLDEANSTLECTLRIKRREIEVKVDDRTVEQGNDEYTTEHLQSWYLWGIGDDGAGFVGDDLENAGATFTYTDKTPLPAGATKYQEVTVEFTNKSLVDTNYYIVSNDGGLLIVTERKVLVTPEYNGGEYVYDGNPVNIGLFGINHVHNLPAEDIAVGDEYGFTEEHYNSLTRTYTFTNKDDATDVYTDGATPVNAGTYVVSVVISGEGSQHYFIEYETCEFTIRKRTVALVVENDGGEIKFVYNNQAPAIKAVATEETEGYDGFVGGVIPNLTYALTLNGNSVERYNVGLYQVGVTFDGAANYDITLITYTVEITRRSMIIGPVSPYAEPQEYAGKNLTLGESDFVVYDGSVAAGDTLTITSGEVAPTVKADSVTIKSVKVTSDGADASGNYDIVYSYDASNARIKELGLNANSFKARLEYKPVELHYTMGAVGGTYQYTGNRITHTFDKDNAVALSAGYTLGYGHRLIVTANQHTVKADAAVYTDWLSRYVRVVDANGANVTIIYTLVCDNAEEEGRPLIVKENVLTVNVNGLTASALDSGSVYTETDGRKLINSANYTVSGLYSDGTTEHKAHLQAFETPDGWRVGIVIYSLNTAGKMVDASVNYKLSLTTSGTDVPVEVVTVEQAAQLARPAITVEIGAGVTQSALAGGKGSMYTLTSDGNWQLAESYYTVNGSLKDGHSVAVFVYKESGVYTLGVVVYSLNSQGKRVDAGNNYNLYLNANTDVSASFVNNSQTTTLRRELFIDFSGATVEDGKLTGFTAEGLNADEEHLIEIAVTENDDGTQTYTVYIYRLVVQGSRVFRYDRSDRYELTCTAPDGVTVVTGKVNAQ